MGNDANAAANVTIQIKESSFNAAVNKIEKANERILANKSNITIAYEQCDMPYLEKYQEIVERLALALEAYYKLLAEDIGNLRTVRDNYKEVDK